MSALTPEAQQAAKDCRKAVSEAAQAINNALAQAALAGFKVEVSWPYGKGPESSPGHIKVRLWSDA